MYFVKFGLILTLFNFAVGPLLGDDFEILKPPNLRLSVISTGLLWCTFVCGVLLVHAAGQRVRERIAHALLALLVVAWCLGACVVVWIQRTPTTELMAQTGLVGLAGAALYCEIMRRRRRRTESTR